MTKRKTRKRAPARKAPVVLRRSWLQIFFDALFSAPGLVISVLVFGWIVALIKILA